MINTKTKITHTDIRIDKEFERLFSALSEDEFKALEDSVFADGIQDAVKVWINPEDSKCYLVDGHNRYTIMDKYGKEIPQDKIAVLDPNKYRTKDDVIFYMLQYQLGRRNLTPYQRSIIVEKFDPILKKRAKENQGTRNDILTNSSKSEPINVRKEKAKMAGVSEDTYAKNIKILKSDNEEVKQKVASGEMSTNAGYNQITGKDQKKESSEPKKQDTIDSLRKKFNTIVEFCPTTEWENLNISSINYAQQKTTADYDKEIANVESEIAALYEIKTQLIQDRHKAFQADNSEMKCEYTEEHNTTWSSYSFYLIKGENKIDLFSYFDDFFIKDYTEFMEDIERKLKYFEFTSENSKYSKLSKDEKAVIAAKLVDMRETVKQDRQSQKEAEEVRKRDRNESFNQNLNQALGNLFRPQFNPVQKATLKKIYKAGAKALHSDVNGGNDEAMQFLNMLKESWGV